MLARTQIEGKGEAACTLVAGAPADPSRSQVTARLVPADAAGGVVVSSTQRQRSDAAVTAVRCGACSGVAVVFDSLCNLWRCADRPQTRGLAAAAAAEGGERRSLGLADRRRWRIGGVLCATALSSV